MTEHEASPARAGEERFPDDVILALHETGVTLGCLPVRIDDGEWLASLFLVLPPDAACVTDGALDGGPFAVSLELDLHEHEHATVVELILDVSTPGAPSGGSVLFLTGHASAHFDALKLLSAQKDLPLFIGDAYCRQLSRQRIPLGDGERAGFRTLLDEAVGRDAVIRMSGRYDAEAAFNDLLRQTSTTHGTFELPKPPPPDVSSA